MWKNKHVVIAMLVAPVLAVIAWFAVDRFVAEEPQPAQPGGAYSLVAKPSCRYASGSCELVNGEFVLSLEHSAGGTLVLTASHALDGVQIATRPAGGDFGVPRAMAASAADGRRWRIDVGGADAQDELRVLARAGGSSYFGETVLLFTAAE